MTGAYITIEGIDGAGKTSLADHLGDEFPEALLTAEPTSGLWTGPIARSTAAKDSSVVTDVMSFAADRSEHLRQIVEPALETGRTVISDRGHHSTYAYQVPRLVDELGWSEAEAVGWLDDLYAGWNREPDAVIWLDATPAVIAGRVDPEEKWSGLEQLERVKEGYERLYDRRPFQFRWVDADAPEDEVRDKAESVVEEVERCS